MDNETSTDWRDNTREGARVAMETSTEQQQNNTEELNMAEIKTLPTKHRTKKVTTEQENTIMVIQKEQKLKTFLEAKHEYFENQESYDKQNIDTEIAVIEDIEADIKTVPVEKPKRKLLTIAETKLGVTVVLTAEECEGIGLNKNLLTKEAIKRIRSKLGVPPKNKK